jgi:hypothetical protein
MIDVGALVANLDRFVRPMHEEVLRQLSPPPPAADPAPASED